MHDGHMPDEERSQEGSIRAKKAFVLLRTAINVISSGMPTNVAIL